VLLTEACQRIHGPSTQQPKIAGVFWNLDTTHTPDDPVKHVRSQPLESGLTHAGSTSCVHNIATVSPVTREFGDQFGWVLKICIDDHHGLSARVV
jgi:hypothetical protein